MVPKHTIYCLGEVLLALDADAPLAHAESFRPRLGGDAAVLAQAGYLEADSQGNFMKTHNPPRLGKATRFYTINGNILDADE